MGFDWQNILLSVTTFINLILALVVLLKNPHSSINKSFSIVLFGIALWALTNAAFRASTDYNLIYFWALISYFSATMISGGLLYFTTIFPSGKMSSLAQRLIFFCSGVVAIAIFIPGFVLQGIKIIGNSKPLVTGPGAYLLFAYMVLFLSWSVVNLIKKYFSEKGISREQIRYILFGLAISIFFGVVLNVFIPIFLNNYSYVALGPNITIFLVVATVYAIVAHRLLDIRLVVARSLSYLLLVFALGTIYSGGLFLTGTLLVKQSMSSASLITSTALALIIAFTFQPLLRFFEKISDHIFFKNRYDSDHLLKELGKIMTSALELDQLVVPLLQILTGEMKINSGTIILINKSEIIWKKTVGQNNSPVFDKQKIIPLINAAFDSRDKVAAMLVFEEMEESPLKEIMRQYGLSIVNPLIVDNQLIGAVLLSDKSSGDIYSGEDINVLKILGPEAAITVRNALSYEQIKRFNITLKEEVERSTKDLKGANFKLRELDQLKDDFVSIASHELRTPMTAIKSYLWMAINRPDIKLSEKMTRYISRAYISTERLINLVNDMLNVSRIESGRIEVRPETFDMQVLVADVLTEVGTKAAEKSLHLRSLGQHVPKVFADEDKVREALLNLIGNALKFTPAEGIITVSYFSDGKSVEVSIADSGVGISRDDLSHLFSKFGRLDNSYVAAATTGGTGLGLYISKSLIELMGGKIWAKSEGLGKGAIFTFSLPAATEQVIAQAEKYTTRAVGGVAKELEPVAI